MVTDIQPGADLDFAVARAIGMKTAIMSSNLPWRPAQVFISHREWDEIRGIEHPTCEGDVACILFAPSTDLNTAFAVAEKELLFGDGVCLLLHRGGLWRIWDDEAFSGCLGEAATPALAICAAILKEKA